MNTEQPRRTLILEASVIIAAILTVPLTVEQLRGNASPSLVLLDWLIWTIFVGEFLIMAALTDDRQRYARRHWLHLVVIALSFPMLPSALAISRLARLSRVARLVLVAGLGVNVVRFALARKGLVYVVAMAGFLVLAAGGLLASLEPETVNGGFGSGVWWAMVTVTTVGYGDITPASTAGRVIAAVLMLTGIGLISTLAASIAAYFIDQDDGTELRQVIERLDRIEQLLLEERGHNLETSEIATPMLSATNE